MNSRVPVYRPTVESLSRVFATDLKNSVAKVFDAVAAKGAIAITRHDKPRAILLSLEEFEALAPPEPEVDLTALRQKYQDMVKEMQSPEQKAAAEAAFNAADEELGAVAFEAMKKRAMK